MKRALDAELYFYSKVFGFDLPEPIEPVEIEHLQDTSHEEGSHDQRPADR